MAKNLPSILFITPGASSAGGNVFLLNFLRWMKENSSLPFTTVCGYGGDLEGAFAELSETYIHDYEWENLSFLQKSRQKIRQALRSKEKKILREIEKKNIGLIYSNAVINHHILSSFSGLNAPLISHCHELESVIRRAGLDGFNETKKRTKQFITVSEAVRQNLLVNHRVSPGKISLIHGFIPVKSFSADDLRMKREKVLRELNLPENAFIIGASGTMYWRKAPEIFVQVALRIKKRQPDLPIYFLWVGGAKKGDFVFFEINYDIQKLGLEDSVFFLEHKPNPLDYFAALDIFALVSREDPFPLVCLEAASLGKPVICFDQAGGMPEFVEKDCGFVVPYLDSEGFAEKILELYFNSEIRGKIGACAENKVRQYHDLTISAPKVLEIIEHFLKR